MPFKSNAQREKFRQMVREGKMKQETFDQWEAETPDGILPDRVTPPSPMIVKVIRPPRIK